ncbi:MAG: YebC/PmpR family DNA-binding transcriptional regulator [Crocinitomicaceae bacterium]|nr:YebC/PmpR family DNA-binding transcriptional regulator [Crocinitomicaceae bacterium]
MGRAFEFRKGRKLKRWGAMSKAFTKIGKELSQAVKEGGPNPESNSRLRVIIQNAKAANMPKDNIERAIAKATSKDTSSYKEMVYEGYGPYGIAILIETLTDNPTRTVANVRAAFTKFNGTLGTSGSLDFAFERKCMFRISAEGINMDEFELEIIDFGGEEVDKDEEENEIIIYGPFESFGSIQKFLDEKKIEIKSAGLERIPTDTKKLTEEEEASVQKLIDRLEEDDDVNNVFHTMGH